MRTPSRLSKKPCKTIGYEIILARQGLLAQSSLKRSRHPEEDERENIVLRITEAKRTPTQAHFVLEGRLVGPWIAELRTAVMDADASGGKVHLDLSGVHFVDAEGLSLLHGLLHQGVEIKAASPYIRELLKTTQ